MKIAYQKLENADGTKEIGEDYLIHGTAKAWANITTTTTTTNNDSLNISSLTDEGTGQTTYNFTSNFSAATYSMIGCSGNNGLIANFPQTSYSAAVGSIRGLTGTDPSTASDAPIVSSEFTGDLA